MGATETYSHGRNLYALGGTESRQDWWNSEPMDSNGSPIALALYHPLPEFGTRRQRQRPITPACGPGYELFAIARRRRGMQPNGGVGTIPATVWGASLPRNGH